MSRSKFDDALGQHMTPPRVAALLSTQLPPDVTFVADLAIGDGALLAPLLGRADGVHLAGFDCDPVRVLQARSLLPNASVKCADGLRAPLVVRRGEGRMAVVGNPPFLPAVPSRHMDRLLNEAFPGVLSSVGRWRMEMAFLARALIEARRRDGLVAMILPSSFSAGLRFAPYRSALLTQYRVLSAIEIRDASYRDTEATTTLVVIDTGASAAQEMSVQAFHSRTDKLSLIYNGVVAPGERWDAGYWRAKALEPSGVPTLRDIGVDVARGRQSFAEAARQNKRVLHTTDLSRLRGTEIELRSVRGSKTDVYAEPGDFLIPRTGTRVRWVPVSVAGGRAPISDHVLRIRPPLGYRRVIADSFAHPHFPEWLMSMSKGVCATVLAKRELLEMPLFALESVRA